MFWEEKSTWFLKSRDSLPGHESVPQFKASDRAAPHSWRSESSALRAETPAAAVSAASGPARLLLLLLLYPV